MDKYEYQVCTEQIKSLIADHRFAEAMEVADEIIVTNEGRIEQIGSADEIYLNPQTPFVAKFIGQSDIITECSKLKGFENIKEDAQAVVRPGFIEVYKVKEGKQYEHASVLEDSVVEHTAFRGWVGFSGSQPTDCSYTSEKVR